jgi:hypothetical protein
MNGFRTVGLILFSLAIPAAAQTQAPPPPEAGANLRKVSLQEALQLAAKQGPDVAAARAQAQIAHAQVDRAWGAWQPDVVANGQYDHTNGAAAVDFRPLLSAVGLPPNSFGPQPLTIVGQNNWYGNASISQPLFTPQGIFGIGAAKAGAEAADRGADQAREQILLSVARAYLGLQGLEGLLQAARDAEKVALRREEDAKARINAGTDVEIGLLRAQTETAGARVQIANIIGQQQNLLPLLEALTGEAVAPLPFGQAPQLALPADESKEPWEDAFSVKSGVAQVSASEQAIRVSRFGWLPSVQAVAKESYTSNEGAAHLGSRPAARARERRRGQAAPGAGQPGGVAGPGPGRLDGLEGQPGGRAGGARSERRAGAAGGAGASAGGGFGARRSGHLARLVGRRPEEVRRPERGRAGADGAGGPQSRDRHLRGPSLQPLPRRQVAWLYKTLVLSCRLNRRPTS